MGCDLLVATCGARPVVRPLRHRNHRPGVARSHECREGATGIYRANPETRKRRKQVSACCAAQTCNARKGRRFGPCARVVIRLAGDILGTRLRDAGAANRGNHTIYRYVYKPTPGLEPGTPSLRVKCVSGRIGTFAGILSGARLHGCAQIAARLGVRVPLVFRGITDSLGGGVASRRPVPVELADHACRGPVALAQPLERQRVPAPGVRARPVVGGRQPTIESPPREHRLDGSVARPPPLDRTRVTRLAVRVGVALAVARLRVRATAAAHALVAGFDRPGLLASRVLSA
jgi:hypothetical protein